MKKWLIAGVVVLFALMVLGAVGIPYVQAQTPPTPPDGFGPGSMGGWGSGMGPGRMGGGFGRGMMGRADGTYGPMHTYMLEAFAGELGLTVEEIQGRIADGETMWEIALSTGLTEEQVASQMLSARTEALERMVADGVLTQEQADWMLERMNRMHQNGFGPGAGPCHGGERGPGGRWNRQQPGA